MLGGIAAVGRGRVVAVLLACLLLSGCIEPTTQVRRERGDRPEREQAERRGDGRLQYVVQQGDTLFRIAFRYQVSVDELVAWNRIADRNRIFVGQSLRVQPPGTRRAPPERVASRERGRDERGQATLAPLPAVAATPPASVPRHTDPDTGVVTAGVVGDGPPPAAVLPAPGRPSGGVRSVPIPAAGAPQLTVAPVEVVPAPGSTSRLPAEATLPAPSQASASPPPSGLAAPSAVRNGWSWPAAGRVVGGFVASDPLRAGIDIAGSEGQPVYAAADGEVVYSGTGILGYGELIVIQHPNGLLSAYGHNRRRLVQEGAKIRRGQQVAEMGSNASGRQQLHFEVRKNGKPVDPLAYLPGR